MDTGAGISNPLFFIGVVENNLDGRLEGRVQVRAFGVHGTIEQVPTESLPWATLVIGSHDTNFVVPPINAWVFGFFLDGRDAQQPMILGLIPTQMTAIIDPEKYGWGALPPRDYDRLGQGSRPEDYGQPTLSRLARGEYADETYNLPLEVTRVRDVQTAGDDGDTWDEPNSAYNAQYPHNRVIETASGHSVELDDTPGAERIMIYHRSGSYVQIDSRGTTTNKSVSDKYEVDERNQHVFVGGRNTVTIEGDSYVLVKGSKIEEIYGDYKQIVHGNHELSVAGQLNLNGSEEAQIRAAKVTIQANVENVSLKAAKDIRINSDVSTHILSTGNIFTQSLDGSINMSAGESILATSEAFINLSSGETTSLKTGGELIIDASGKLSLQSSGVVAIDGSQIQLDGGQSSSADDSAVAEGAEASVGVDLPEPAFKAPNVSGGGASGGTSGVGSRPSVGTSGIASQDDFEPVTNFESNCSTNLIEYLKGMEKFRPTPYEDYGQLSIGYGIATDNKNERIDEAEAERRLIARVNKDRSIVKAYGSRNGYNWNDCQIDALTSFVFNLGTGRLNTVTGEGQRTNAEIAYAITLYDKAGDETLKGLTSRRKFESEWFAAGGTS